MLDALIRIGIRSLLSAGLISGTLLSENALAGGKIGLNLINMRPYGDDAEDFSRPGWGAGLFGVIPLPHTKKLLAGVVGIEGVNLMENGSTIYDPLIGYNVVQGTSQDYFRLYLGMQAGGHGNAFLRPHAGLNFAVVWYSISTGSAIDDFYGPGQDLVLKSKGKTKGLFGYDITLGLDLNFSNTVALDGGVKYLKSFSQPQQLGPGTVKINPQYIQIYAGIGFSFRLLNKIKDNE